MKIAFLNTFTSAGGASQACNRIYAALKENTAHSFHINNQFDNRFSYYNPRNWPGMIRLTFEKTFLLPELKDKKLKFQFDTGRFGKSLTNNRFIKTADIVHLHWINQGFITLNEINKYLKSGKKVVQTLHDMWPFTGGCFYSGECDHYLDKCGYCPYLEGNKSEDLSWKIWNNKANIYKDSGIVWVCPSKWLFESAKNSSLGKYVSIYYIPYPIDTQLFRPADKGKILMEYNLDPDKYYLLFGAHNINDPRKGLIYLIEAMKELSARYRELNREIELIIFGRNNDLSVLDDLPFTYHYLGFLDNINELIKLYNLADFFILPSIDDNLPNMILESLACGTPVIAYNRGGIPDMISHKKNGYLAEPRNVTSLANGIEFFYKNHHQREFFSSSARRKAEQDFSYKKIAGEYENLYQKIKVSDSY